MKSEEVSKIMTIVTNYGSFSYKVLPQGVCNSSALWKILTDGNSMLDSELGKDISDLEQKIEKFLKFVKTKNLKLNSTLEKK